MPKVRKLQRTLAFGQAVPGINLSENEAPGTISSAGRPVFPLHRRRAFQHDNGK